VPGTPDWAQHQPIFDIDSRDLATPDAWVPRHPELIRLTGRHAPARSSLRDLRSPL